MANPKIKVKRSSVEGKVPAVTQLERGELAVNSYDGKVYILKDQFSVGIATTTHTINPWNEPNGVGAGISYSGDIKVRSTVTEQLKVSGVTTMTGMLRIDSGNLQVYGTAPNIFLRDTNDNPDYRFMNSHGSIKIFDETNGVDRFIINPNGKVSILKDLDVDGHTFLDNVSISGVSTTSGLTVGNYDFPTTVGSEGLVLKVASDGNLEFGSGAAGGVVPTEKTFTATQGQTVFTDTSTLPTYIQVFVNGIKIRPTTDFSKSGSSVTLVTAATAGDEIDLVRFD